eukprot:422905-Pelagomonas_calceolata.AAC.5
MRARNASMCKAWCAKGEVRQWVHVKGAFLGPILAFEHARKSLLEGKVCSGASRALKMSSSNAQIPAPISPRFDKSSVGVETCSLNWLAQAWALPDCAAFNLDIDESLICAMACTH